MNLLFILVCVIMGIFIFFKILNFVSRKTNRLSKNDVLIILKNFVEGKGGEWDWDDFVSVPIADNELDAIRERCAGLPEEFPPLNKGEYCNAEGEKVLRKTITELEK